MREFQVDKEWFRTTDSWRGLWKIRHLPGEYEIVKIMSTSEVHSEKAVRAEARRIAKKLANKQEKE